MHKHDFLYLEQKINFITTITSSLCNWDNNDSSLFLYLEVLFGIIISLYILVPVVYEAHALERAGMASSMSLTVLGLLNP